MALGLTEQAQSHGTRESAPASNRKGEGEKVSDSGEMVLMTRVITERVEQVVLDELDLRLASLRLLHPAEVARLRASVVRDGMLQPVLAATKVEPGRRVLVDGFKRVRVARELGLAHLTTSLLALDGPMALAMMLRSNAAQRGMCALEEGWVMRRLCREHGLTQAQAGAMVGHEQSWVCHRLRLVEQLAEELQSDLRLGLLAPAVARELGRLPSGLQINAARAVREHGLLSRQAARLAQRLLATDDPRERREVLADPLRYLAIEPAEQTANASKTDSRLSPGGNDLRKSLLGFEGAAFRLGRSVMSHAPKGLRGEEARILTPLLGQATTAGRRILTQLDDVSHGRSRARDRAAGQNAQEEETTDAQPS